jgi:uncharacterized protein (DUF2141 family)
MKRVKRIFAICLLLIPLSYLSAQSSLTVEIVELESNKGVVIVDLLDTTEESVRDTTVKISDNKCIIVFEDVKNGQYAIRYFHDENSDEEMETNFLGIPKDGFGFSNDAMGKFGPKDFSEWLFEVSVDTTIKMTTKYF